MNTRRVYSRQQPHKFLVLALVFVILGILYYAIGLSRPPGRESVASAWVLPWPFWMISIGLVVWSAVGCYRYIEFGEDIRVARGMRIQRFGYREVVRFLYREDSADRANGPPPRYLSIRLDLTNDRLIQFEIRSGDLPVVCEALSGRLRPHDVARRELEAREAVEAIKGSEAERLANLSLGAFAGLLAVLLAGFFVWDFREDYHLAIVSRNWAKVQASAFTADVASVADKSDTVYSPTVDYRYTVRGKEYHGHRYSISKIYNPDRRELRRRLQRTKRPMIWYDPEMPERLVCVRQLGEVQQFLAIVSTLLFFGGLLALILSARAVIVSLRAKAPT